jgi:hypothetical protein
METLPLIRGTLLLAAASLLVGAIVRFGDAPPGSAQAMDLLARVDVDGDGRVGPDEYARAGDGELPMSVADADGSGFLEPWEIDALIRHVSPLRASMSWVPRAR